MKIYNFVSLTYLCIIIYKNVYFFVINTHLGQRLKIKALTLSGTYLLLFPGKRLGCYLLIVNDLLYGMLDSIIFNDLSVGIGFGALIAHLAFMRIDIAQEIIFCLSRLSCISTLITYAFCFFNWNYLKNE